jgi:Na+/H+-dicarboxylate symporter
VLGGSLGLGILITVFAAAGDGLAHRLSAALTVGTGMLALALALVVALIVRPRRGIEVGPPAAESQAMATAGRPRRGAARP